MKQKELLPMFPPSCCMNGLLLLVPPAEFHKLKGRMLEGNRMFLLVAEGALDMELNGKPYEMQAHSFLDVMEMASVHLRQFSSDLRAWCLFIAYEFARESLKNLHPGPRMHLLKRLHLPFLQLSPEENVLLERQLELLKESLGNQRHYYRQELVHLYFRGFSLELGNIMFMHEEHSGTSNDSLSRQDVVTLNFVKLVSEHFAEEHTIDFYADALSISPKHLTRIIKEMTGKTPHAVICNEMTHHALAMLEDEGVTVGEVADKLHFSDQAAFCKFFKKQVGVSPAAYRKRQNVL